jgi:hypothetical protein
MDGWTAWMGSSFLSFVLYFFFFFFFFFFLWELFKRPILERSYSTTLLLPV